LNINNLYTYSLFNLINIQGYLASNLNYLNNLKA
jgi:hypothetical protein